ncbi:MAG TPA: glycosyltransferase, partial [Hyphomicrobiaceae bacterium]|nr:glycosyltransferase [Hyphomicrobiaceae bacterium]
RQVFRILHCLRAPVGGLFRHVRDLAAEQAREGHFVGILCDASARDSLTRQRLAGTEKHLKLGLHRIEMTRGLGISDFGAYCKTRDIAKTMQIDVIHGHGAKGGAYARLAASALRSRGTQTAAIYTPHGGSLHFDLRTPKGFVFMALERKLLRATDAILFESHYSRTRYTEKVAHPTCIQQVIHNGLAPNEFIAVPPAGNAADILYIGELRTLKGVDCLIRAIAELNATTPTTANIVGEGPDKTQFEALAVELGVADKIKFLGAMPASDAFPLGRCLAMPSRAESLPYVVLEAAAAAIPLIATSVGGIPEIVAGTDTNLIPPDNAPALAAAISTTLAALPAARHKAARLQAAVQTSFSVGGMSRAVLAAYLAAHRAQLASQSMRSAA